MESEHIVVYITAPAGKIGEQIALALLEKQLIASANIISNLRSIYTWKGEICQSDEVLLMIKTRAELFERVTQVVKTIHPYEVPGIVALPILAGSPDYLEWIDRVTVEE